MAELVRRVDNLDISSLPRTSLGTLAYPSNVDMFPQYSLGRSSQGGIYVTNPLNNYEAYAQESQLERSFGLAGSLIGPAVRAMYDQPRSLTLFNRSGELLQTGSPPQSGIGFDVLDSSGKPMVSGQVSIGFDLANRQATLGTSEWARKIVNDMTPVSRSDPNYSYIMETSVDQKRAMAMGGISYGMGTSERIGSYTTIKSTYEPVRYFTENDTLFRTVNENVSHYGIPTIGSLSTLAPYGTFSGQQGMIFGPQVHLEAVFRPTSGATTIQVNHSKVNEWSAPVSYTGSNNTRIIDAGHITLGSMSGGYNYSSSQRPAISTLSSTRSGSLMSYSSSQGTGGIRR